MEQQRSFLGTGSFETKMTKGPDVRPAAMTNFYRPDDWELYDLARDPNEMHSVYADPGYGKIATQMKDELTRLKKQYRIPEDPTQ
jgi:hypothetical protein